MRHLRLGFGGFAALAFCLSLMLLTPPLQAADSDPQAFETGEAENLLGDALVSVNGARIERARFNAAFARIAAFSTAADPKALALDVLNGLIDDELILQFAIENDLDAADEAVEDEIERLKDNMGADRWDEWLKKNLYSPEQFREELRQHLVTLAVREHVTAHLREGALHARARHILVAQESEAQLVIRRLRAGENFAALAAALSLDVSTREDGGDLGWFIRGELLDRRLGEAAFSQDLGDIGGPIATRLGYHVLQVIGRAERGIEAGRLPYLIETTFTLWLEAQLEAADIRFDLEALESLAGAMP